MKLDVLENVPKKELPNSYQKLLDPNEYIRYGVVFFEDELEVEFAGKLPKIIFGGFTAMYLFFYWIPNIFRIMKGEIESGILILSTVLTIVPGWIAYYSYKQSKKQKKNYQLLDIGQWRIGWFITGDAILYYSGKSCTLIPRENVFDVNISNPALSGMETMDEEHCIKYSGDGYWSILTIPHEMELEDKFKRWMRTGKF